MQPLYNPACRFPHSDYPMCQTAALLVRRSAQSLRVSSDYMGRVHRLCLATFPDDKCMLCRCVCMYVPLCAKVVDHPSDLTSSVGSTATEASTCHHHRRVYAPRPVLFLLLYAPLLSLPRTSTSACASSWSSVIKLLPMMPLRLLAPLPRPTLSPPPWRSHTCASLGTEGEPRWGGVDREVGRRGGCRGQMMLPNT